MPAGKSYQVFQRHLAGKTYNPEIAGMYLQEHSGFRCDGILIVAKMGPVCGPYFDQFRSAFLHNIRNNDSNKSYGLGVEAYENDAISFQLEWVRYFDNRYYRVDAWNLGLVTRF